MKHEDIAKAEAAAVEGPHRLGGAEGDTETWAVNPGEYHKEKNHMASIMNDSIGGGVGLGFGPWASGYGHGGRGLEGKDASFLIGSRIVDAVRDGQAHAIRDQIQVLKELADTRREIAEGKLEAVKAVFEARQDVAKEADRTRDLVLLLDRRRDDKDHARVEAELLAFRQRCGDLKSCTNPCNSGGA
jgi:hypothetical protein